MNYTAVTSFSELTVGDSLIIDTHGTFEEVEYESHNQSSIFPYRVVGNGKDYFGGYKSFYLNQIKINITKTCKEREC